MAFVSSPSSTNEVNTAYGISTANTQVSPASTQVSTTSTQVSTANLSDATVYAFLANQPNGSQLVHEDLEQIHEDGLKEMDLKWQLALLSMRTRRFFQKTGRKITINGSDTSGYDKSKVECFNCHKMGHFARECKGPRNQDSRNRNQDSSRRTINVEETSSKAMVAIGEVGFDWSCMADDEVPTNMTLMVFSDSEVYNDKTCSKTCLKSFETLNTQLDDLRIEFNKSDFNLATYKRGLASVEDQLVFYKKNEVIFCEQLVVLKRDISYKDSEISMLKSELENIKQEKESNQLKIENFDNASKSLDKLIWSQIPDKSRKGVGFSEFEGYGPKTSESISEDISNEVRESPHAPLVEELVSNDKLEKKTIFPTVTSFDHVLADYNYHQRERVVSGNNYTRVNYNYSAKHAHPSAHRNIVPRAVLMKTSLRPLNTARHVNIAHVKTTVYSARTMSHFKEFDGGYVTFGGGAKGGKITGKGTLKTGKLDFEDVYFVKELQFNLFSVSQMCDKKNSVLFTDTGCFVLSPDFKLADESQVLLKVPRKNNMYSVDMKNIVPKESLTCLVAKATLDESMLWHRRLGHVNFKTINKLVKENLVRGLPIKHFENDQTYGCLLKGSNTKLLNRVLVVKPHNKNPYELFRGRTPALSFMRPFGCHVTILNTLYYLGKFDGKSNEGFFVGYSLNSNAFRVYNIRTRKVEENLHVRFLEDKPIIAGDGPKWLFDIDVLTKSINYVPVVAGTNSNDFIDSSLFDSSSKNASNDEPQPSNDAGKKDDEGVSKESGIDDQEMPKNNTQDDNTVGPSINTASTNVNTISLNINIVYPTVTTASLEAIHADFFGNSGVQTRRMTKTSNEQGFISAVYEGKTHLDLHTCLFACFISHEEPKKVIQALKDPSWIEVMQEELLQFKLEQVWTLVDLPYGKRAIGTKWVYRNKKDERGIGIRNKARLVAQGYTQEEGIDYDEIEEEVYVCQPPGFEDPEFLDRVYKVEKALYYIKLLELGLQVTQKDDGIFISQDKYVDEILKKFGFSTVKTASTHMETSKPLMKDENAEDVDVHLYRSMIGSLMYLTSSRPDIMFVYPKDSPFDLEAYTDSEYAGASLDRKSTIRGCQFLRSRMISWQCKKQTVVANSTTEAEYMAAASCCGQVFANMRRQGKDFSGTMKPLIATMFIQPQADVGEGSGHPIDFQHPSTTASPSTLEPIHVSSSLQPQKTHRPRKAKRKATEISQSSGLTTLVADETVHEERGDSVERAATTAASLDAE
ncbi:putative ribonuclease H-like domain-containing protein [Tanacetum coccineum]